MRLIDADKLCEDLLKRWDIADKQAEEIIGKFMAYIITPIVVSHPTVNQWIPCSERLPSEQDYKACYEAPNGIVWYCTSEGLIGLGWYYESTWEWANLNNEAIVGDVIAWMPLPEPYKGV